MHLPAVTLALATLVTLVVAFTALWHQLPFILHGVVLNALCSPGNGQVVMPSCPSMASVVPRQENAANGEQLFVQPVNVSLPTAMPAAAVKTDMKATFTAWLQVPSQVWDWSRSSLAVAKAQAKRGREAFVAGPSIKIQGWEEFFKALMCTFAGFLSILVGLLWLAATANL